MTNRHRFWRQAAIAASLCTLTGIAWAQTSTAPLPPAGRLLASNCFQCHGTNGNPRVAGFDRLADKSANDIFEKLKEFQTQNDPNNIMKVHALGYTDAQLRAIADYFSRQPH